MTDTRWIKPYLDWLKRGQIPNYPVDWVGVTFDPNEIILIKFHPRKGFPK